MGREKMTIKTNRDSVWKYCHDNVEIKKLQQSSPTLPHTANFTENPEFMT